MNIKKGDNIIVISGKDKGKKGKVIRALPKADRVVVEGVNLVKRRQRPKKEGQKGQVIEVTMPMHISNVMIIDPKKGVRTRISKKLLKDKWVRIAKKSGSGI